jgi:hypothetical protein
MISRETNVFSRFEYHIFYVLYPFETYLVTLARRIYIYSPRFYSAKVVRQLVSTDEITS